MKRNFFAVLLSAVAFAAPVEDIMGNLPDAPAFTT
jgi:cathepsin A (carboxypeptidase C)